MNHENLKPEEILGNIIEDGRKNKGYGVRALARRIDVAHSYVRDITQGHRLPSEAIILKLCEELDLDCDEMMRLAGRVSASVYQHVQRSKAFGIFIRQLAEQQATDDEIRLLSSKFQEFLRGRSPELRAMLLERKKEQEKP